MASLFSALSTFLFGSPKVGRPAAPTSQISGGGVHHTGGWVVGAERNPKLVGVNRHVLYQEGIANTDAVATPLRALMWLVGDVDWDVEPHKDEEAEQEQRTPSNGVVKPNSSPSLKPPAAKPLPSGGGPFRQPGKLSKADREAKYSSKGPKTPEEAVAWLKEVLFEEMTTDWPRLIRRLCMYRPHGYSIHEWVAMVREDDTFGLKDIVEVPHTTITQWNLDEDTAEFYGVVTQIPNDGSQRYLGRKKMVYIVDDALAQGDPAGMGLMRHCVEKVQQLRRFEQLEGVGYETELVGVPKGTAPLKEMKDLVDTGQMTPAQYTAATAVLDDFIRNHIKNPSLGLVLDSEPYRDLGQNAAPGSTKKWDLELLTSSGGPHKPMNDAIERKGREIARVWSAEGFYLGGGDGSHAMSKEKTKMFAALCNATAGDLAAAINRDVVKMLWKLNNFDPELMPKLCPGRVDLDDVAAVATSMKDWSAAQLAPEDPATNAFRKLLRLPALPLHIAQQKAEMDMAVQQAELAATDAKTQATLKPPARPAAPGAAKKPARPAK